MAPSPFNFIRTLRLKITGMVFAVRAHRFIGRQWTLNRLRATPVKSHVIKASAASSDMEQPTPII